MYSDREAGNDPLDYVHSSLSQGNKVIYYQKECYRRTLSCPVSASSSITNLDSCGKPEGPASSIPATWSSRSHSSSSMDSGGKQSRALVSEDWEEEETDVFEDVTQPSPGAKKFVAALSDVVLHDEAAGKLSEPIKPENKDQYLDSGPLESDDKQADSTDTETETPVLHSVNGNLPGYKTQRLDTEANRSYRNKMLWQGAIRSDGNENKPRWSDSGTSKPMQKPYWQNAAKREIETWLSSSSTEPGNEPQRRDSDTDGNKPLRRDGDTDKAADKNGMDAIPAKPKRQSNSKQTTKSTDSFSSEPILMKLPKGKLVMTRLSVVEKLSLPYIEEGHVKVLSNVREPDDQNCYLFIPDAKNYPEVLENLLEVVLKEADTSLFVV